MQNHLAPLSVAARMVDAIPPLLSLLLLMAYMPRQSRIMPVLIGKVRHSRSQLNHGDEQGFHQRPGRA